MSTHHCGSVEVSFTVLPAGHVVADRAGPRDAVVHDDELPVRVEISGDLALQQAVDTAVGEACRVWREQAAGAGTGKGTDPLKMQQITDP